MKRFVTLVASLALAALAMGCGGGATNKEAASNYNTVRFETTKVDSGPGDYEAFAKQRFGKVPKDFGDKVGSGPTDGWLWVKARGKLLAAEDLEISGINVDVDNGAITLRGTVPSQVEVKRADEAIKEIAGIKSVDNQLKASA